MVKLLIQHELNSFWGLKFINNIELWDPEMQGLTTIGTIGHNRYKKKKIYILSFILCPIVTIVVYCFFRGGSNQSA